MASAAPEAKSTAQDEAAEPYEPGGPGGPGGPPVPLTPDDTKSCDTEPVYAPYEHELTAFSIDEHGTLLADGLCTRPDCERAIRCGRRHDGVCMGCACFIYAICRADNAGVRIVYQHGGKHRTATLRTENVYVSEDGEKFDLWDYVLSNDDMLGSVWNAAVVVWKDGCGTTADPDFAPALLTHQHLLLECSTWVVRRRRGLRYP